MTKLRVWDRLLSALMGILCILAAAAIVLHVAGWLTLQQIRDVIAELTAGMQPWIFWALFAVAMLLLVLLGVHGVGMLFRRRKDKGFVIQRTEYGDMNISIKALENMVKKCVEAHSELTANYTRIYLVRGGVSMDMKITLASGVNIPLTVNTLQKQIKQYVTSCSGVDVHEVRVKVETDNVKLLPPPQMPVIEPVAAEPMKHVEDYAEISVQHEKFCSASETASVEETVTVSEIEKIEEAEEPPVMEADAEKNAETIETDNAETEPAEPAAAENALEKAADELPEENRTEEAEE